jgi:hypothetical protein
MKRIFIGVILPVMVIFSIGLTSCNSCSKKAAVKQEKIAEKDTVKTEFKKQLESKVYPLPTSAEVIQKLTKLEVGFIFGITNPVDNAKKYFSSTARAVNLGIFGADLSYTTLYNMNQEVLNYLNAIRTLTNELNMSKIYNEQLYEDIKKNFDNRDQLVRILTNAFNNTYTFLSDNDQQNLALLVVGGAWVEGMYLTTHVSEAAYQDAYFSKVLLEQKESFNVFMNITQPYASDASISDFRKLLEPVSNVYEKLSSSLTLQNIKDITKAVSDVRSKLIQ